jgi:hypothetical protein
MSLWILDTDHVSLLLERHPKISRRVAEVGSEDKIAIEEDKFIAQKRLDENLVLRVVYREFNAFILVITLYPGRRSRYEKD